MNRSGRPKILFYCQSLVGIGHLTSTLWLIRELLGHSDVDLIYGGQAVRVMPEHPGFRHLRLKTVLIDSGTDALYAPDCELPMEAVWAERENAMLQFEQGPYAAVFLEFFPFGRRRLKKEILALLRRAKRGQADIPVFTFVREILVPAPLQADQRMVQLAREHIHTIFVRGDPEIVRFEETFARTAEIQDLLFYAGYVSPPPMPRRPERERVILVSQGGGEIGRDVLEAAIRAAPLLPEYRFMVITSSRATETEVAGLRALVESPNVEIVNFLSHFQDTLARAALSISLGGDNTLMDVISTRTPALAFPYPGNSEQALRIAKLAQRGFVFPLTPEDLIAERLVQKALDVMDRPYPDYTIRVNGAAVISQRVEAILNASREDVQIHHSNRPHN